MPETRKKKLTTYFINLCTASFTLLNNLNTKVLRVFLQVFSNIITLCKPEKSEVFRNVNENIMRAFKLSFSSGFLLASTSENTKFSEIYQDISYCILCRGRRLLAALNYPVMREV
jgi:hypothetical protein